MKERTLLIGFICLVLLITIGVLLVDTALPITGGYVLVALLRGVVAGTTIIILILAIKCMCKFLKDK